MDTPISLGEPTTPLLRQTWHGLDVGFKLEGALPTGSFKDRGVAVLASWLVQHGARAAVIDSSGNAGASLAAYCARAGLACHVFAPQSASPGKLRQIAAYGAELHSIAGSRQDVSDAALAHALATGDVYASHAWNPLFLAGTQTFAYEAWEQLGGTAPDAVVLPVGAGTLLLGIIRGYAALHTAGLIDRIPRVYGIQSTACAPLVTDTTEPAPVTVGDTAAEGIRIARPPRGRSILSSVRDTGGQIIAVDDEALWRAHDELRLSGIYVEPTSAIAVAGLASLTNQLTPGTTVLVPITATGLKSPA
ncbi:threonine synthase [Acrocarpospora corrugata]|uniref:threonine synthase n=1 Tax=Acrocarpospora corrugata TaxID=35763 RepID=UPI001478E04A|nr:threonine synthase [Acrocarpospora corrugata]